MENQEATRRSKKRQERPTLLEIAETKKERQEETRRG